MGFVLAVPLPTVVVVALTQGDSIRSISSKWHDPDFLCCLMNLRELKIGGTVEVHLDALGEQFFPLFCWGGFGHLVILDGWV